MDKNIEILKEGFDKKWTVFYWYINTLYPEKVRYYDDLVKEGKELINPISAVENLIRNNNTLSYKDALELASNALPHDKQIAKEAVRFLLRWEPDIKKNIMHLFLERTPEFKIEEDTLQKQIAQSLITIQLLISNWNNPVFLTKLKEQQIRIKPSDATEDKIKQKQCIMYWNVLANITPKWMQFCWDAINVKMPDKYKIDWNKRMTEAKQILISKNDVNIKVLKSFMPNAFDINNPTNR